MQVYIINRNTMKTMAVVQAVSFEINESADSLALSSFTFAHDFDATSGDYLYIKDVYLGIVTGKQAEKATSDVTLTAAPPGILFSRSILLGAPNNVTENYIKSAILDNFTNSGDAFFDYRNITVVAATQSNLGITPHNDNGIYNLATFMFYVAKRHNIFIDYALSASGLAVSIEKRTPKTRTIDATLSDIITLSETVTAELVSKVVVKTPLSSIIYYLYLGGTFGTDPLAESRMPGGRMETLYCENPAEADKTAGDVFLKNMYSHLIELALPISSKLYDPNEMSVFDFVNIKTNSGIYQSFISAKTLRAGIVYLKIGGAKVTLTDKLRASENEPTSSGGSGGGGSVDVSDILKKVYPVGSIYMSTTEQDPSAFISGTSWERWGQGRVPLGVGQDTGTSNYPNANAKGGHEKLQSHTHKVTATGSVDSGTASGNTGNQSADHSHSLSLTSGAESASHSHSVSGTSGAESAHTHKAANGSYAVGSGSASTYTYFTNGGATSPQNTGAGSSHSHSFSATSGANSAGHTHGVSGNSGGVSANHTHSFSSAHSHGFSGTEAVSTSAGTGNAENVPPYITCFMYRRVS